VGGETLPKDGEVTPVPSPTWDHSPTLRGAGGNCSAWRQWGVQGIPLHTVGCVWGDTHGEGDVQVQMRLLDLPLEQGDVMVCSLQLDGHLDRLVEATEMNPQHCCVGVVEHSWGRDHINPGKEKS